MKTPYEEYIEALTELRIAIQQLHNQAFETRNAISEVVNNSHLSSILTLQKEDIGFRRLMELAK